jgi:DNA-binding IclR family transcriptional regulator
MVEHTARILETLGAASHPLRLKEITAASGSGRTSAFRVLHTLAKLGYITKNEQRGTYQLATKLFEIAWQGYKSVGIVQCVRPYMQQLCKLFDETVNLAVLQDTGIFYAAVTESSQAFRMEAKVGSPAPLHATAVGKAISAFQKPEDVKKLVKNCAWNRITPRTIRSQGRYFKELKKVRALGYGLDNEEAEIGASCVAAPITNAGGEAIGALSISGPTHRIRRKRKGIIRELKKACTTVSGVLVSVENQGFHLET